ncbi:cyclic pyranopterin monophosphate synthase MoaC [bacterium]|nr:cyclic pyranopterin monophosphate synthase MoaC [bacterium]
MPEKLTHIDADGRARMVDVSAKAVTERRAVAIGRVMMSAEALGLARSRGGKGDVRAAAEIAGVMAAKRTADLIPMCHPLMLSSVKVRVEEAAGATALDVRAEVGVSGVTGVEMEALTAVSVACLTIYDMLKSADKGMRIEGIRLIEKTGGKSGTWRSADSDQSTVAGGKR